MKTQVNKQIVGTWFNAIWGETYAPEVINQLAAPNMVMQYPIHGRHVGPEAIKAMLDRLREAFPDLKFWVIGDIIAEGDYVFGRWEGGGTHTGPEFKDLPAGKLPENSGKKIHFTGMTIFKIVDGKIVEEIGEEDALKAALQLGVVNIF
ncbi:ester cyclase [Puteibacter caeruleilacunae]|nr:ester cyclase [Puteibacter caeruleilacunae]